MLMLLWAQGRLLSDRVVYFPGHLNVGEDNLSRQVLRPRDWRLHLEVQQRGSGSVRHRGVDPLSPLVFSHTSSSTGTGFHGTNVTEGFILRVFLNPSAPGSSGQSRAKGSSPIASCSFLASSSVVLGPSIFPERLSLGDSDHTLKKCVGSKKKKIVRDSLHLFVFYYDNF